MEDLFISKQLKQVRLEKQLTLDELAKRTGFTKSLLSKIENNKVSPPLSTLMRITRALDVSLSELFRAAEARHIEIVRGNQKSQRPMSKVDGQMMESLVQGFPQQKFEPILVTIDNQVSHELKLYDHPGQEFIYVLTGKMKYVYGNEEYFVEAGDSLYFYADVPHGAIPMQGEKVTYISILSL
ncbi:MULTISPECIES: XRE family transcriptional regulator [Desulfosporosinus]|uniref:HTH-type transcriptional regulator PuuR n=1 Tax=Desulfosporosinus acididurans TaxID=476652 RepID=A0A0J1IHH3_9FIRM|nr:MULTISPECIES: XRE family transcriptional regulator [Desulfosporosinus]KLU64121.1 HTH-type transcriptional regulator PuuR [Desulfosporosinus acididurans]